jgi:hypothetical protein
MRKTVMLKGTRLYVEYDVDLHGNRTIQHVLMPGDLMEITEKLSDDERRRLQRSIDREPRRR